MVGRALSDAPVHRRVGRAMGTHRANSARWGPRLVGRAMPCKLALSLGNC